MNTNNNSTNYIEQLTWLRGIAAFFVILSHTIRATGVSYNQAEETSYFFNDYFFNLGSFGVVLFFALSGCTLYISNANKLIKKGIRHFYIKRFFRIWPAFVVSLFVYITFRGIFSTYYGEAQQFWIERQFLLPYSITDVLSYLSFTFNISGPEELFNNAYWSLPVEFQYYLIFPIIIYSLIYLGFMGPLLISAILYALPRLGFINFNDNLFFILSFSFCGGVLVGYIYKKYNFLIKPRTGFFILILLVLFIFRVNDSYLILSNIPIISNTWLWHCLTAISAVFILLNTKIEVHSKFESFLKYYGTISYSTYLYHNIFIGIAILLIINFEIYNSTFKIIFTLVFTLITTYYCASLSYKYIEKPFIAIGRKML